MSVADTPTSWAERLPARKFFERLCLVKTITDNDAAAVSPGNEVAAYGLWPALRFNSHKELINFLKMAEGLESANLLIGKITVEYFKLVRNASKSSKVKSYGVAYLLGKGDVANSLALLPQTIEGESIGHTFDFCEHFEMMMGEEGHCATPQFKEAFEVAMERMEAAMKEKATPANVKKEKTATMTTVNSARKTFTHVEYSEYASPEKMSKMRTKKHAELECGEEPPEREGEDVEGEEEDESTGAEDEAQLPVKHVQFLGNGSEDPVSSPERSYHSDEESQAEFFHRREEGSEAGAAKYNSEPSPGVVRSKSQRSTPVNSRVMPWAEMHRRMTADGWDYVRGNGLIEWYYTHPRCKGMKKKELLRQTEGEDYFTSEDDLKTYARINLGWRTECHEQCKDSPNDAELADRIKKRKRGQLITVAVKPAAEDVKKGKASSKAKPAKGNKQGNHSRQDKKAAAPNSPESLASVDCDASRSSQGSSESRFSLSPEVSVSQRTRSSAKGSPTFSELELNAGVEKSSRKNSRRKQLKFSQESAEDYSSSSQSTASGRSGSSGSGTSGSHSEMSSLDETYEIMAGSAAWRLLIDKFGFTHHGGQFYCLPGKENKPGKDSDAVEGLNYFASLEDLRKNLCAYGLPEVKQNKYLPEEDAVDLNHWVRYAHVGLPAGTPVNPRDVGGGEQISGSKAWSMLAKLGLWFSGGCYVIPNSDPTKPPFRFERQQAYLAHLARFGIPRVDGIEDDVMSKEDRLRLNLFIADTDEVDTFKRIDPGSENVNEITPRRSRSRRSSANESELARPAEKKAASAAEQTNKHTLKLRRYQNEFNQLSAQRTLSARLTSSREALAMLVDSYNCNVIERDGEKLYCLPNVELTEGDNSTLGRDYFQTIQEMRENFCAYGLPLIAKGAKLGDDEKIGIETWVRCANMDALRNETSIVPEFTAMKPKETRSLLKKLGYTFSDNVGVVVLPGTSLHNSKPGINRFNKLIDLFNHIARFGLVLDQPSSELDVPDEMRLKIEIFAATVATFDVSKRIRCDAPIKRRSLAVMEETATSAKAATSLSTEGNGAAAKSAVSATPTHPAVVNESDQEDTPRPSPPKKAKTNTLANYFPTATNAANVAKSVIDGVVGATVGAIGWTLSPVKSSRRKAGDESSASASCTLSPSCLDEKGDEEVEEACLADTPERDMLLKQENPHQPEEEFDTPKHEAKAPDRTIQSAPMDIGSAPEHYPQAESPDMPWKDMWAQMRQAGWKHTNGSELVAWYYIHPCAAKLTKGELHRQCTVGVHYFTSEDAVKRYAAAHLGWAGEVSEPSPTSDMSMTARVKKRKQRNEAKSNAEPSPLKKARATLEDSHSKVGSPTNKSLGSGNGGTARSRQSKSPSSQTADNNSVGSRSSKGGKAYKALPDQEDTVRAKLECCQLVLHPSFKKNQLSKSSTTSVVSAHEDDIKDFMMKSIETGMDVDGLTLPSPGFMYICGGPGTGKTTAVMSCAAEMKKWAKKSGYDKPIFCDINMASVAPNCQGGIMRTMLKKMAKDLQIDKDAKLGAFEKQFAKKVFVLILDEIDMLFKQHGGIGETWFKTLVEWAEEKEMSFSMIGISNCVNDVNAIRVRELGHSPRELVFSAYREVDILAILEQRLGKNIVDPKALQLISRKVSGSSGDARRALEITSNAVGKCADLLSDDKLEMKVKEDDECMPLVKLPHMMRAIREGMPMKHGDVISGLPQAAKVVLCIAVSLSQVWGPTAEITVATLKKYCIEATHHALMDELGLGHIMNLVELLVDSGLLVAGNNGHFNKQDANARLKIGVQLDDVEIALEQSLLNEGGFYRSLVDYVKRECPR